MKIQNLKTPENQKICRTLLWNVMFWFVTLLYLETVLHIALFRSMSIRYLYLIGFTMTISLVLTGLTQLPRKANQIVSLIVVIVLCILYESQLIYDAIFGSMYSISMVSMGGQAITSFWKEMFSTIWDHLPVVLLELVPIPVTCLLWKRKGEEIFGTCRKPRALLLIAALVLHGIMVLTLRIGGTGFYTTYNTYYGSDATTDQATESFGLLTDIRLEVIHLFRGETGTDYFISTESNVEKDDEYEYNVMDIDFDALMNMTQDEQVKKLSQYCASLKPTKKNEYTGMLKDYNLIMLCGESFSSAAIDPVLTPTLYKLSHEGIVFNNYYNSFPNTTTNGEYALNTGLMPDMNRGKRDSSFYASRNSYLPFCLGNEFKSQKDVQAYGYHNYYGSYYGRYLTHPNIGYKMKFAGQGMNFTTSWPASDLEMMEQSVSDYIGQKQFMAYYMTFSGHYKYERDLNPMAARNYEAVENLDLSEHAKCYLSCNIELDKALQYLLEQLEAAGVADRTAIVLAGDHFPYGLSKEEYSELIGHETDYFERYKDTLIFWVGGLEKPIQVDEYCCNIDILPTILNLWGFDYDSRLLPGTDVFSDGTHVAILADQSFVTDKVKFNASSNTVEYQVDSDTLVPDYLRNMQQIVKNRFNASADILNKAYYNIVFDQGEVVVGDDAWISEADWNGTNHTGFQTNPDMPEEEDPILEPNTPETPVVPVTPTVDNRGSVIN